MFSVKFNDLSSIGILILLANRKFLIEILLIQRNFLREIILILNNYFLKVINLVFIQLAVTNLGLMSNIYKSQAWKAGALGA